MILNKNDENPWQFIGDGELHVTVHKGPQQWSIAHTIEHFKNAQWAFYADGRFVFTPPALVALRKDLQPMMGRYSLEDSTIEFAAEQYISQSTSSSLDGTIHQQGEQMLLHAVYTLASHTPLIVVIEQPLSQLAQMAIASPLPVKMYGRVAVPSAFTIELEGVVDSRSFGPLPATLKILPTTSPLDTNPFMVELALEDPNILGAIYWTSFLAYIHDQGELISKIEILSDSQLRLTVTYNQNRLTPSWSTFLQIGSKDIPVGAWALDGTMTLFVQDDTISGEIRARGCTYADHPDTGPFSIYQAQLTGKKLVI
jgi:hypothetical protein